MTLTLDNLLINLEDFSEFRDISKNTDIDRLDVYIRESQIREVRNFLGDALYFALVADYTPIPNDEGTFATQRFTDLWYGKDYQVGGFTIQFYGLKPAHIYYAYERFLYNQKVQVTRYGVRTLSDNDLSDNIEITKKYEVSADSMGLVYQNDARKFLDSDPSVYPEWNNPVKKQTETTGLKMFKVGREIGR